MSDKLDPELVPALAAQAAEAARPARGDWRAVRAAASAGLAYIASLTPPSSGVTTTSFSTPAGDGQGEIAPRGTHRQRDTETRGGLHPRRRHARRQHRPLRRSRLLVRRGKWRAVPVRRATTRPEATSPTSPAQDVFRGLTWLEDHATDLRVDPSRIAVMGDSGGGPTAGAAILARDRDVPAAKQILLYPMLDDRNTTPGSRPAELLTWSYDNNYTGG